MPKARMTFQSIDAGTALRGYRQRSGIARAAFAALLGVSPSVVTRAERGFLVDAAFYEALVRRGIISAVPSR